MRFTGADVVRHPLVTKIVAAYDLAAARGGTAPDAAMPEPDGRAAADSTSWWRPAIGPHRDGAPGASAPRAAAIAGARPHLTPAAEVSFVFTDDDTFRAQPPLPRDRFARPTSCRFRRRVDARRLRPPSRRCRLRLYETVAREAAAGGLPFDHHLSHLIVHGFLHLLAYDHETEGEAAAMEKLETLILARPRRRRSVCRSRRELTRPTP